MAKPKVTADELTRRYREVHGDFYDYSLIGEDYQGQHGPPVRVVCPEHGVFRVDAYQHSLPKIQSECPKCVGAVEARKLVRVLELANPWERGTILKRFEKLLRFRTATDKHFLPKE